MENEKNYTEVGYMKVFDFKGIEEEGIKKIIPINPRKTPERVSWSCKTDKRTGITFGILNGTDKKGNPMFKRLWLEGEKSFNLAHAEEAKEYYLHKNHSPYVLGSKSIQGKPLFKAYSENEQSAKALEDLSKGKKAMDVAFDMPEKDMMDFARLLGITPEDNIPLTVRKLVVEKALKQPKEFMELYEDPNRITREIVERSQATGLIAYDAATGYMYKNGYVLGATINGAISHLNKELSLRNSIDKESRALSGNIQEEVKENSKETDADIRAKAKELEIDKYWMKGIPKLKKEIELIENGQEA